MNVGCDATQYVPVHAFVGRSSDASFEYEDTPFFEYCSGLNW
jgi:hypothetical protein